MNYTHEQCHSACDLYGKLSLIILNDIDHVEFRRVSQLTANELITYISEHISDLPQDIQIDFTNLKERYYQITGSTPSAELMLGALHSESKFKAMYYASIAI